MSKNVYPRRQVQVPMPKVQEGKQQSERKNKTFRPRTPEEVRTPKQLIKTTIQQGHGVVKPSFSLSGAKVNDTNVVYFGVHGDVVKISLSDEDVETLMDVLEDLLDVGTK